MRFVLLLVMLSSSLGCGASALSSASSQWYEVRSPRFRLWTEGDPEEARALAQEQSM